MPQEPLFVEVSYGPVLVEGNVFLLSRSVRAPKDNPPPEFKPVIPERLGVAPAISQPYPAPAVSHPNLASW